MTRAISISSRSSITGDRRSSGPATDNLVLARKLPDQPARRVGKERQPFGQFGAGGEFGVGNEADQDVVEQIDVIGPEIRGP